MDMKARPVDMKFRVKDAAHSAAIQRKLFEMGYSWPGKGKAVHRTDEKFLYAKSWPHRMEVTYGVTEEHFEDENSCTEHILWNDEFHPRQSLKAKTIERLEARMSAKAGTIEAEDLVTDGCTASKIVAHSITPEKPPLGLIPRKYHDANRVREILEAMDRYNTASMKIPKEWVLELFSLTQYEEPVA